MTILAKTKDKKEYTSRLGSFASSKHIYDHADADVLVGGNDAVVGPRVIPQIYGEKWNGEAWFSVNDKSQIVQNEIPSFAEGKLHLTIGEKKNRWYVRHDGSLEWELEYATKPLNNVVEFEIKCSENLRFVFQDTLENDFYTWKSVIENEGKKMPFALDTLEKFLTCFHRPDNVVGSYAVYGPKKYGKYMTGKVGHIYRPEVIDANGERAWCELHIDKTSYPYLMRITMPQSFLDKMVYPIILDPNFGYDTEGGSGGGATNFHDGSPWTTSGQSGEVSKIWHFTHANTGTTDGTYHIKLGVYDNDYSDLMASDVIHTINEDDQWVSENYSFSLVDSTKYYMTVLWENGDTQTAYDSDTNGDDCYDSGGNYAAGMQEPWTPDSCGIDYNFSIYVEYGSSSSSSLSSESSSSLSSSSLSSESSSSLSSSSLSSESSSSLSSSSLSSESSSSLSSSSLSSESSSSLSSSSLSSESSSSLSSSSLSSESSSSLSSSSLSSESSSSLSSESSSSLSSESISSESSSSLSSSSLSSSSYSSESSSSLSSESSSSLSSSSLSSESSSSLSSSSLSSESSSSLSSSSLSSSSLSSSSWSSDSSASLSSESSSSLSSSSLSSSSYSSESSSSYSSESSSSLSSSSLSSSSYSSESSSSYSSESSSSLSSSSLSSSSLSSSSSSLSSSSSSSQGAVTTPSCRTITIDAEGRITEIDAETRRVTITC